MLNRRDQHTAPLEPARCNVPATFARHQPKLETEDGSTTVAIAGLGTIGLSVARSIDQGKAPGFKLVAVASRDPETARAADEVVISLFVGGPRLSTFPVELFWMVEEPSDPLPAAIPVVLVLVTLIVSLLLERLVGLRKAIGHR